MLYWLLYQKLFPIFQVRSGYFATCHVSDGVFASLTALLIALLIGPWVIERLREFQIGQYIREERTEGATRRKPWNANHGRRADLALRSSCRRCSGQ